MIDIAGEPETLRTTQLAARNAVGCANALEVIQLYCQIGTPQVLAREPDLHLLEDCAQALGAPIVVNPGLPG